ncbi:MAG: XisI protein [Aridibacter sp.]
MEKIDELRDAVKESLLEWKEFITPRISPEDQKLEAKTVFDDENNSYLLLFSGWKGNQRIHSLLIHIEIIGDKIWIQEDNTEEGVAADLEKSGIAKNDIVLGFQPPSVRKFTEYAAL